MRLLLTIALTTILLSHTTTSVYCQTPCNDTDVNKEDVQSHDFQDSHVEHVKVRQRTGFDGKVRSIRFGIDSDNNYDNSIKRQPQLQQQVPNVDTAEAVFSSTEINLNSSEDYDKSNNKESITSESTDTPKELSTETDQTTYESIISDSKPIVEAPRKRRSVNSRNININELENDLQAEEAKVFRPLFVYRNQVGKRLKLQNEKSGISGYGNQRVKSSSHRRYHPYRYSPYRYYPSG